MLSALQRLCKARMFSDFLSWLNLWGWQSILVEAAVTLPLGITSSKQYTELEDRARAHGRARMRLARGSGGVGQGPARRPGVPVGRAFAAQL